jgi:hypothetical protein
MKLHFTRIGLLLAAMLAAVAAGSTIADASRRTTGDPADIHAVWDGLLRRYVKSSRDGVNRVDYVAWKARGLGPLKAYIASLEKIDPATLQRNTQMAFWINLYNAKTAEIVLERYPVASIKDIDLKDPDGKPADGPWKAKVVTGAGRRLSLDEIGDSILRAQFKDPRIHYALNCLSIGCPNLLPQAYTAARLERQLDSAARAFVNHPRGISFTGGKVQASSIFEWYAGDFGGFDGVIAHMRKYARPALAKQLTGLKKIDAYDYDWKLNDVRR